MQLSSSSSISSNRTSKVELPSYTEAYTSPPYAAGVPVLELIRKLEEEKQLSRDDRLALNGALYDPDQREKIMKALRDVELGSNPKFAVRRLKALIYHNGGGELSSKLSNIPKAEEVPQFLQQQQQQQQQQPGSDSTKNDDNNNNNNNSPSYKNPGSNSKSSIRGSPIRETVFDDALLYSPAKTDPMSAINSVVGHSPSYKGTGGDNICAKIALRVQEFFKAYKPAKMGVRKFAVIVGNGSMNPLTRMHLRTYFLAKQALEMRYGYIVLGSILSPAHGSTVRERYRFNPSEIIPSPHRLAMAQLLVQDSKWVTIDPWEITRRRPMDVLSLLEHTHEMFTQQFTDIEIKLFYLCKTNMVPKLSPLAFKQQSFACACVCRPPDSDNLRSSASSKWNGHLFVIEDSAILDASMDIVTSRKVRDNIKANKQIDELVGDTVEQYVNNHKLGLKMLGEEDWVDQEKMLPRIASRPMGPTLKSQIRKLEFPSMMLMQQIAEHDGDIMTSVTGTEIEEEDNFSYNPDMQLQKPNNNIDELAQLMHQVESSASGKVAKRSAVSSNNNVHNMNNNLSIPEQQNVGTAVPSTNSSRRQQQTGVAIHKGHSGVGILSAAYIPSWLPTKPK